MRDDNPFLDQAFHIRWSQLTPEKIAPAITQALAGAEHAIAEIVAEPPRPLTYENTFLALEKATEELTSAWGKVTHLQSVADSPELRAAHNAMLPQVSAFYASIPLNAPLWHRLKAFGLSAAGRALTGIDRRFVDETVADFQQAGADLPEDRRARLTALQTELAGATQKYAENVLDATNAGEILVADEKSLAGLPAHAKEAARRNAEEKQLAGWRFTLHQPAVEPFMTYLDDGALRRQMWEASIGVGAKAPFDNTSLISKILRLRAEKATLLGKPHFADLVLQRRMAKSGQRALDFLDDLHGRARAAFRRECGDLETFKGNGASAGPLAPWEIAYWSEKMRRANYDFDEELLRPYFPMNRVIAGLFELASRLFGLRIVERPAGEVEVWHPEVKFYDMFGPTGAQVGSFYADWHPRESKQGGAWMNYLITGGPRQDGQRAPHLGLICGNMTPPVGAQPALLTHREVETIFHEFGHLLHHLLGEVKIKSLNGVNVAWDFVELPSQIMENWTWERESLDLFARHYQTGEPIPTEMFQKLTAARNFRSACATMRQIAFAKLDLVLHTRTSEFADEADVETKARAAIADCLIPTHPPGPTLLKRFTHLFASPVGYAAGYYSYKWAEVLDADAFTRFQREGLFSPVVGREFVDKVLSRGNSVDAAELFRSFMGREPDLNALLKRSGLLTAA